MAKFFFTPGYATCVPYSLLAASAPFTRWTSSTIGFVHPCLTSRQRASSARSMWHHLRKSLQPHLSLLFLQYPLVSGCVRVRFRVRFLEKWCRPISRKKCLLFSLIVQSFRWNAQSPANLGRKHLLKMWVLVPKCSCRPHWTKTTKVKGFRLQTALLSVPNQVFEKKNNWEQLRCFCAKNQHRQKTQQLRGRSAPTAPILA